MAFKVGQYKHSEETKEYLRKINTGRKISDITKKKMSENHWSRTGKYRPKRNRIKKKCKVCGKEVEITKYRAKTFKYCSRKCFAEVKKVTTKFPKLTEEQHKKRGDTLKRNGSLKGTKNPCFGRKGKLNPQWKGGISTLNNRLRTQFEMLEWKRQVLIRDSFTCVKCGLKEKLQVDHIKPFALFPKLRLDINNGQTLCLDCHKQKTKADHKKYNLTNKKS